MGVLELLIAMLQGLRLRPALIALGVLVLLFALAVWLDPEPATDDDVIRLWISCDGKRIMVQRLSEPNPPILDVKEIPEGGAISFALEITP